MQTESKGVFIPVNQQGWGVWPQSTASVKVCDRRFLCGQKDQSGLFLRY